MENSLTQLVALAQRNYLRLQGVLHPQAGEIAELRAAGVIETRIEALYPYDRGEYAPVIARAAKALTSRHPLLVDRLVRLDALNFNYLPGPIADGSEAYRSMANSKNAKEKLALLVYYFYIISRYDPTAWIVGSENEESAQKAWDTALEDMRLATALLEDLELHALARKKAGPRSKAF